MMSEEADKVQMLEGMRDGLLVRPCNSRISATQRLVMTSDGVVLVNRQRSSELLSHDKWRLETYQQLEMLKLQLLKDSGFGDDSDEVEDRDVESDDAQVSDSAAARMARSIDQVACSKGLDGDELEFEEGRLPTSFEVLELESMMEKAMLDMAGRLSAARSTGACASRPCPVVGCPHFPFGLRQGRRWRRENRTWQREVHPTSMQ
jgi:hypothetical protein